MASNRYNIKGMVVRHSNKEAISDVRVEVWDKDLVYDDLVGSTITADDGSFEIIFDRRYFAELFFDRKPDLFFKIFYGQLLICSTEEKVWKNVNPGYDEAIIELNDEEFSLLVSRKESSKKFTISGRVVNGYKEGIAGKTVVAYDVDLKGAKIYKTAKTVAELDESGGMEFLGKAKSSRDGTYSISFAEDKFKTAERGLADVVVYAVATQSTNPDIASSDIIGRSEMTADSNYVGNEVKDWNVYLTSSLERGQTEYEKLISEIEPFAKESGVELHELFDSDDQINFLASETKQDKTNTAIAIKAARLSNDASKLKEKFELSSELIYGIGRQQVELDWNRLYLRSKDELREAIKKSGNLNYISNQDDKTVEIFLIALSDAAFEIASTSKENEDFFKIISFTLKDSSLQKTFLQSYNQYKNRPQDLWDALSKKDGFTNKVIESLLLTNQLSIITAGNTALIDKFQNGRNINDPSDLLELDNEDWNNIFEKNDISIPASIPGNSDNERKANYIASMQNMLNAAYPTKKIAVMLKNDELQFDNKNIQDKVQAFLEGAKGFDIRTSRITDFSKEIKQVAGEEIYNEVLSHLHRTQRIYQVSPTPQVLSTLIRKGYSSAYHISAVSRSSFIKMEAQDLGGTDIAFSTYNRAKHQVARSQYIIGKVRDTQHSAMLDKIMSSRQRLAVLDYVNQLNSSSTTSPANWSKLFGSPQDCECKDCNSVFSPSSYLVDIMQYLDHCPSNGAGSKSVLQVLFERRPDIGKLLLTCENTNTEIPYIDLVNEIMEYYVAHSQNNTIPFNAGDTGIATAEELKAEPQYTLMDAYKAIYKKVYPFNLPYYQPLDVMRTYLNFLKTSRAELMEVFNKSIPPAAIDAERMQLSLNEYEILNEDESAFSFDFSGKIVVKKPVEEYYGNPAPTYTNNGILVTDLLQRAGVEYAALLDILKTKFINPGQTALEVLSAMLLKQKGVNVNQIYHDLNTFKTDITKPIEELLVSNNIISVSDQNNFKSWLINNFVSFQQVVTAYQFESEKDNITGCNIDYIVLHSVKWLYEVDTTNGFAADKLKNDKSLEPGADNYVGKAFLSRLHRFIRLWRKTGWAIHELDTIIDALGETDITPVLIHKLSVIKKINSILNLPLLQLAGLWGNIDTYGENSMYAQLFLKNTGNVIDNAAKKSIFQPSVLNEILLASAAEKLDDHLPEVFAAFSISADDYNAVITKPEITNNFISLSNLSFLHKYKLLANALDLSIQNICALEALFGSAFGYYKILNANKKGISKSIVFVDNLPRSITVSVMQNSNQVSISVSGISKIIAANFQVDDKIELNGKIYSIASLPTGLNTSTISFNIDKEYADETNAKLNRSLVRFFKPDPDTTLNFIQKIKALQASGFEVNGLKYILTGMAKDADNIALPKSQILQALPDLRSKLLKIDNDNPASDTNIITPDLLSKKLMLLYSKDISDHFISMLRSTVSPVFFEKTFDQSYVIGDAQSQKYQYKIAYAYSNNKQFQINEKIIDANGSTAEILSLTDSTLLLKKMQLVNPNNAFNGTITGGISGATATINAIFLQMIGVMTNEEYDGFKNNNDITPKFKTATENLYKQSTSLIYQQFGITAPQVICNADLNPDIDIFPIPKSLSPKYEYILNRELQQYFFKCNGIMTDSEKNSLNNAQLQNAVNYIYNYPFNFIKNNFSGFYDDGDDDIIKTLFGINDQTLPALTDKMKTFYQKLLPFIISQLKQKQIVASISSLISLDTKITSDVLELDMSELIDAASLIGLKGSYINSANNNDAVFANQKDPRIDFNFGTGLPQTKPPVTSPAFCVNWQGWLCPPTDGIYLFTLAHENSNDQAQLFIDDILVSSPQSLSGGKLYKIKVVYQHPEAGNAGIHLYWQSANMPQAIVDSQFLFPDDTVQNFLDRVALYHRASKFITGFNLTEPEVAYILKHSSDFASINFLSITADQWSRINDYTILRKTIPANLLLMIFQQAYKEDPVVLDDLISLVANSVKPNWNKDYLLYLISYYQYQAANFKNEIALLRIKKAMDLSVKTKMPISDKGLPLWNIIEKDPASADDFDKLHDVAEEIKNAVKAKYKDNWLTVATQLNNKIREKQKQVLISYMLTLGLTDPADATLKITDADGLFEYLLIDVQMTSAVMTSRIIQATLAVQLFVNRVSLKLEREVAVDAIDYTEWEWMKHYSLYAGLKQIPVYTENFLHPSLRDDKSPFFKEFESELKKSDITEEAVENAFRNYLVKLNEVSNMEVCGFYEDTDTQTIYVFARTKGGKVTNYYFRIRDKFLHWQPWEQVQLDIKGVDTTDNKDVDLKGGSHGVHLIPVVWNKRLFLFWPEFTQKSIARKYGSRTLQQGADSSPDDNAPQQYWQINLAWSEYLNGKWVPKKLSKNFLAPLYFNGSEEDVINLLLIEPSHLFWKAMIQANQLFIDLFISPNIFSKESIFLGQFAMKDPEKDLDSIYVGNIINTNVVSKIKFSFRSINMPNTKGNVTRSEIVPDPDFPNMATNVYSLIIRFHYIYDNISLFREIYIMSIVLNPGDTFNILSQDLFFETYNDCSIELFLFDFYDFLLLHKSFDVTLQQLQNGNALNFPLSFTTREGENILQNIFWLNCYIEFQGNRIVDTSNTIVKISQTGEIPANQDFQYQSYYQAFAKKGKLTFNSRDFLTKEGNYHMVLTSSYNIISMDDFGKDLNQSFIYVDGSRQKSYFVTPVHLNSLKSIVPASYPSNSPLAVLYNEKQRHLNYTVYQKVPENDLLSPPTKPTPITTGVKKTAGIISKSYDPNMHNCSEDWRALALSENTASAGLVSDALYRRGLAFYTFFHPFTSYFITRLNLGGVAALLAADTCEFPKDANWPDISPYKTYPPIDTSTKVSANDGGFNFMNNYNPNPNYVQQNNPNDPSHNYYLECVDFSEYGTYSSYNWELFFHAPLLIAITLGKNGKPKEALKYIRTILDLHSIEKPIDDEHPNSPYWQVLPFKRQLADDIFSDIQKLKGYDVNPADPNNPQENKQIDAWRTDPLNPFKIARSRPIAFMKNVLMTYVEICITGGDALFQTYTRENIMEAIQWYVMAHHALGPSPQFIPSRGKLQPKSYNELKPFLNDFGEAFVQMENIFPNSGEVMQIADETPGVLGHTSTLYFCIPPNNKLLQYWKTIGDRLFKIRHGLNIQGISVPLPLYEPPIDPELLLQAKAQGIDISNILADLEAPASLYRFTYTLQKAKEFCNEVISLGNSILSINEKRDAEELAGLRQTQEIAMLNLVTNVKSRAVLEAQANIDNLKASRDTAIKKLKHYSVELLGNAEPDVKNPKELPEDVDENTSLDQFNTSIQEITSSIDVSLVNTDESGVKIIPKEKQELDYNVDAKWWQLGGNAGEMLASILTMFPKTETMVAPFGVGVKITATDGFAWGAAASAVARAAMGVSNYYSALSVEASRMANYIRREQDWVFQANMAEREIVQLDKQIIAAQIRLQILQHELDNHNAAIQNAQDIETFYETKFTNQELYEWMLERIQDVHKQGYQLAYDMARKAEKAYRFELGIQQSNFIQYGYYNDSYLGITAGEQLQLALKQLESAYLENNVREFELTKHISIVQLNPAALIQLKETGACQINLPEELFDMDYPGHYFRRIKSVSISIPCIAGPYTTINSTLRLQKNSLRINTNPTDSKDYPRKTENGVAVNDERFIENNIPFTAIATSSAQNDSGMFELNFKDERYLPFEGAGVISSWQLELNGKYLNSDDGSLTDLSQFNYDTISDIIIHLKYTSREDAGLFKQYAIQNLQKYFSGGTLMRLFSVRHEFPNEWNQFLNQPAGGSTKQTLSLSIDANRFPYYASVNTVKLEKLEILAETKDIGNLSLSINNGALDFISVPNYGTLLYALTNDFKDMTIPIELNITHDAGEQLYTKDNLLDLFVLVSYSVK